MIRRVIARVLVAMLCGVLTSCGDRSEPLDSGVGPGDAGTAVDAAECAEIETRCDGQCTPLELDPLNCGTCGRVCPFDTPDCTRGTCQPASCVDVHGEDVVCAESEVCCGSECCAADERCGLLPRGGLPFYPTGCVPVP